MKEPFVDYTICKCHLMDVSEEDNFKVGCEINPTTDPVRININHPSNNGKMHVPADAVIALRD